MEIHTVFFDGTGQTRTDFKRLRDVFIASCRQHMPHARLVVHNIPACQMQGRAYGMTSNTYKLAKWVEIAEAAKEDIVLCDCDVMFVNSIDDAFELDFDLAYTRRTGLLPFNSGVVFLRPTDHAKACMRKWLAVNNEMFRNSPFHMRYRDKYAGMNQAAWGYLLESGELPGKVISVDPKYNACGSDNAGDDVRVIHIKDDVRAACLIPNMIAKSHRLHPIAAKFREFESNASDNGKV